MQYLPWLCEVFMNKKSQNLLTLTFKKIKEDVEEMCKTSTESRQFFLNSSLALISIRYSWAEASRIAQI